MAALVEDRTCLLYLISFYVHAGNQKEDLESILRAWRHTHKKSGKVILAGGFHNADKCQPALWERFLHNFGCSDVNPALGTFVHHAGVSMLDRCVVPETRVATAKLNPFVTALQAHTVTDTRF